MEVSRGRAVFEVVAPGELRAFLEALLASSGPQLEIVPLESDDDALTLRVEFQEPPQPESEAPDAFDTPDRNRY